mmetsp:Transcript_22793/g.70031  ORF Transcript_22793/g.70031 Transcript_22793/m.70031 type:complete len:82 (+) Transcript_22793:146-391(+)
MPGQSKPCEKKNAVTKRAGGTFTNSASGGAKNENAAGVRVPTLGDGSTLTLTPGAPVRAALAKQQRATAGRGVQRAGTEQN